MLDHRIADKVNILRNGFRTEGSSLASNRIAAHIANGSVKFVRTDPATHAVDEALIRGRAAYSIGYGTSATTNRAANDTTLHSSV